MKTVELCAQEYDTAAIGRIRQILMEQGWAIHDDEWCVVGSQEIQSITWRRGSEEVVLETETYMGVSLVGPEKIVDAIKASVDEQLKP